MLKKIGNLFIVALIFGLFVFALGVGLEKQDVADCHKLEQQSIDFADSGFYLTQAESDMCQALGIDISAPVLR